jgi:hypothetical protein
VFLLLCLQLAFCLDYERGTPRSVKLGGGPAPLRLVFALWLADGFCSYFTTGGARRGAKNAGL